MLLIAGRLLFNRHSWLSQSIFIDDEWNYREILLGFEPLHAFHSGANLSAVIFDLLQQYVIIDRVLSITTDNASNNLTLMESMHDSFQPSQVKLMPLQR